MNPASGREVYRIGDLLLDGASRTLYRDGRVVPLAYRSAQLLLELARNYPSVVRRIDLIESVWPNEDVTDQALSQRISVLRKEIGDSADSPRYIGRMWGWGYHLLAPVERLGEEASPPGAESPHPVTSPSGEAAPGPTAEAVPDGSPREGLATPILPGQRLGPYEVLGPLGTGGMGEVYKARDTRLGREVAVKVLPAVVSKDPVRLHRFEQEARAAASLNHPNIVVLYDIGTHEGTPFLVTELLEGASLRRLLQRGPLPPARVVELGVQMAQGLAAAHEKGIVHRDLKPDNLFVTKDGVLKILDFGLARLRSPEAVQSGADSRAPRSDGPTREGQVLGTPGYMSPEQVRGQATDARSDIFSLGCILYEMAFGRRPFRGPTPADVAAAILTQDPPAQDESSRRIPPKLDRIIRRCLEKKPTGRFSTARDLSFALEALAVAALPTSAPRATWHEVADWLRGHWMPLAAGLGAAALLTAVVGWGIFGKRSLRAKTGPMLEPKRVVVAVFENQTKDPSLDPLGRMASELIAESLSRLECVETVSASLVFALASSRPASPPSRDPVLALAEATGAGLVVSGTIYTQGQGLHLQAKITDANAGRPLYVVEPVDGDRDKPMGALEALQKRVVDVVAARQLTPQDLLIEEAKPPSYEAYKEFIIGEEFFGADYPTAVAHFNRALDLDPDFVLPLGGLLVSAYNAGDYAEAERQWARLESRRRSLTPIQRRKDDFWRARLGGREEEALSAIRDVAKLAVGDINSTYMLAADLLYSNRPKEAVEVLGQKAHWELFVATNRPIGEAYFGVLCAALHLLGQHRRELAEARRGRSVYPDHLSLGRCEVDALVALGRVEEAESLMRQSLGLPSQMGTPGDVLCDAAIELRVHGYREASLRVAGQAAEWYRGRPEEERGREAVRLALGTSLYQAERWGEAVAVFGELAEAHPDEVAYGGMLGALAARRGDRAEAARLASSLEKISRPYLFGGPAYQRARISALLGDKQSAVGFLREAISQGLKDVPGVTFQGGYVLALHRDKDFESLRGYQPFEELLKPRG
jgi:serine/threonine protein kinase/DNA-binding winged helix-turn-helix (wHTH) protein/tetratricopeptide (TPR) repeat protein